MKLKEIIHKVYAVNIDSDIAIKKLSIDSREIDSGDCFVAVKGERFDGADYIENAIASGAVAVIVASEVFFESVRSNTKVVVVGLPDLATKLGNLAAAFYSFPSRDMNVVGVTGTNGKSSMVYLLAAALKFIKKKSAFIGTMGYGDVDNYNYATRTTEMAIKLQHMFSQLSEKKFSHVAMEVSSHGISQHRIVGVDFNGLIFTNISGDHLDYHGDIASYAETKLSIFKREGLDIIITNIDDDFGKKIVRRHGGDNVVCYGLQSNIQEFGCKYVAANYINYTMAGTNLKIQSSWGSVNVSTRLIGTGNVYNILAISAYLLFAGVDLLDLPVIISSLPNIPGRMEVFGGGNKPTVVVDYAHSEDSFAAVLKFLMAHCSGSLVSVFGCGGERPVDRRSGMGRVADLYADKIILTQDNPRGENIADINSTILANISDNTKVTLIDDRDDAIENAINSCKCGDVVLVSGKGHEQYQHIKGGRYRHSDVEVVLKHLAGHSQD
ncbi:MAG: UDP-N-acetylmuramoyl-L-alanyl-D-glutamate--2,6-diaminopimelate ligase [Legionellales bacterium]|jgi:UDP-N-acetylmuramoyl-L-alanyl-D-glutamate--2,6-diaminopimelate ligase|nr:UDP-N-acetylmuramoyl-L-alanyl-D-glutamate--2,6-diaminopimelate ligase [Legionellales bacterium]